MRRTTNDAELNQQNKKIRLMQITHDLAIGGLQQVVVNICKALNRDIFEVSVLCLREIGEFAAEIEKLGVKVIYLPQKVNGTDYFSFLKVGWERVTRLHPSFSSRIVAVSLGSVNTW